MTKTTFVDAVFTSTGYDDIGEVTSSTDANGNTTSYGYDKAGRRTIVTDALNEVTSFGYDADGNQTLITDARTNTTTFQYDKDNRRTAVVYPDQTSDQMGYDALGRMTSKTDQAGKVTQYGFDSLGRLTSVTDALNHVTQYGYDELGEEITQTDALGRVTSFQYDKLGRRVQRTLPMGKSETYGYNAAGNMTSRTDFNGKTTVYAYDSMNRLLSKTPDASFASIPGFPSGTFSAPITFSYTATGRRASMTDPSGTTSYSYDSRDRLISKATPEGTLTYSYDAVSSLLSTQSSNTNGVNIAYSYDKLNRLATVTDNAPLTGNRPATGTTNYNYDPVGNLSGYLYPNGVQTSYSYNSLNRLTSMTVAKGSGASATNLASYSYTLGPAGNRTAVVELTGRTVNYGYDDIYRLTSETLSADPTTANNGAVNYSYDAVGNRLARNSTIAAVPSTTSTFNANDQLGSDTYDSNGSTTASAGKTYVYDFENHIIAVNPGTPSAISIVYDGDGNRLAKTASGVTTKYLVDDNNLTGSAQVVEEATGGNVSRTYALGLMLISEAQLISSNWTPAFYAFDGHGSVRFLTNSSGGATDSYDYDAFGILIHHSGSTSNVYLYSGEQFDPDIGLYFQRERYLNVASGRFWTMDDFEGDRDDPRSLHKYLYAGDDPVNRKDPSGRSSASLQETTEVLAIEQVIVAIAALALANVGTAVITKIEQENHPRILYHYAPLENILGILLDKQLWPSIGDPNDPNTDAQWGDGQYFTDLPPREASSGSMFQLARALFSTWWHWGSVTRRIGYVGVDTAGVPMIPARKLFSNTYGPYFIYVHLSTTNLPLLGRIFDAGELHFAK